MSVFINRDKELTLLNKRFKSNRAEFVVIYGRQRIGKSELIEQFIKNNGIRLLAREEIKTLQLRIFSQKLGNFFNDEFLKKFISPIGMVFLNTCPVKLVRNWS